MNARAIWGEVITALGDVLHVRITIEVVPVTAWIPQVQAR